MPSGAATTTSKVAFSPSPSERPENSGLTPIIGRRGDHRQRELALDRAAAGLGHAHGDLRLERPRRRRQLVERDGEARLAVVVGLRQVFERLAGGLDLLVGEAELVAGKARPLARRR